MRAISIANNPIHHDMMKHVALDKHFIFENEKKKERHIQIQTPARFQMADVLSVN